ncbi:MAG TPA: sugar phosphate isomerase/epimerase [Terracidiphilus sp.]|nr:sugar phosphate isomerase/epimerase [Terracidiphilus sp.]
MSERISRRNFVRTTALAAAAGPCFAATVEATRTFPATDLGRPSPIKLGLASYTFRNFNRTQIITWMKQLNISGLNAKDVKDHLPMDPAAETQALADYEASGIHLHAAGTVYFPKDEDEDVRSKFEYCKRAGIKVIVAGDPTPATLPRIEKFVKEYDIKIAIHNHGPEDKLWPGPLDVYRDIRSLDPRIGCCIDVGHAARAGTDVPKAIRTIGPRVFDIHMKDLTDFSSRESQVSVGQGIMPIHDIFLALIAIRYAGWVDLEYEVHGDDPMPGVTESFAYMRGVLAGMGYNSHTN